MAGFASGLAHLILGLLLWLSFPAPIAADDESGLPPQPADSGEDEPGTRSLQLVPGYYDVSYEDAVLGRVLGEALVAEDGSVSVTYRNPLTGKSFALKSAPALVENDQLVLVFEGRSPSSEREDGSDLPGRFLVAAPEQTIRVVVGDREIEQSVEPRGPSDEDRVEVRLGLTEDGELVGTWSYVADPVTFRDRGGFGRVGEIVRRDDRVEMVGVESWARQGAVVFGALVVHDQTGLSDSRWDYPFDARFVLPDDPPHLQNAFKRRIILVYGRNLPKTHDDDFTLVEADPTIDYELWGLDTDKFHDFGGPDPGVVRRDFALGVERLLANLAPEEQTEARGLDMLLLRATMVSGVEPGWHDFALNGSPGRWQLLFGNVRAEVSFVRQYGAEFEASREILLPETVYIEVRVPAITALTEIPVALAIDGTFFSFDGEPTIPAYYVGLAPPGQASLLRRLKPGPLPAVYRTGPLRFVRMPEDDTITLAPGQRLHAKVVHAGVLQGAAGIAEARIIGKTTDALAGRGVGPWFLGDDLWEMALDRAARCNGLQFGPPWRGREDQPVELVRNLIVTDAAFRELSIDLGHHAAMLLLRDAFVALMRDQLAALETLDDTASVLGFRSLMREAAISADLPLGRRLVSVPNGDPQPFALTFDLARARAQLGFDREAASAWALAATREVMQGYIDDVRHSLQMAQAVGECALQDLLRLTGFGFDPVVRLLVPWLMLPDLEAGAIVDWLPDSRARGYVVGLSTLAEAVKDQQDLSSIDTQVVLLAASAVALPAMYFQSAWLGHLVAHGALSARAGAAASQAISAFGLAVDVADLSQVVFQQIPSGVGSRAEARFALGAAAVLGTGRLMAAEAERESWASTAFAVVLAGYGAYRGVKQFGEIPDVYLLARWGPDYVAMQRGAALAQRFADSGLAGLTRRQRLDLFRFLEDADALRRSGGAEALTALQREALQAFDGALAVWRGAGDLPAWALTLDDGTLRAIAPVIRLPYLRDLLAAEDGSVVLALLKGPDRAEVASILLYNPIRSSIDLVERMLVNEARIRQPVPGLFRVADFKEEAGVRRLLFESEGIITRALETPDGKLRLQFVHYADALRRDAIGRYIRSYDRNKGMFVFEEAFLREAPGFVKSLPVDLLPDRGTPSNLLLNLASMNHYGIGFAGSGEPLRVLKLSRVVNAENNFHLEWLRRVYGDRIPQEGLRELSSVQYAEAALNQAGYEIVQVRARLREAKRNLLHDARDFFDRLPGETDEALDQRFRALADRYFGPESADEFGTEFTNWVDIEIEVRPIGR